MRQEGRRDFQIDLGISLFNTAIEWDVADEEGRPAWVRQGPYIPCDCEECYFCLNGHTTGIEHRGKKQKVTTVFANGARRKNWILITRTQGTSTPGHRKSLLTSHGRSKVSAKKRTLVAARTCVVRSKMWHSR